MANNIKGITVEIGGDTGPLKGVLKDVNKTAGDLQSELKEVNRQLKFDPQNSVLLKQKMDLLKESTQALKEKQDVLKEAVSQAQAQFEKGDLGADKVRAVEREYEKVTSQLKDTKQQLNAIEKDYGTFGEHIKATFASIGTSIKSTFTWDNIKTGIGAVGVAIAGLLKGATDSATMAQEKTETLSNLLENQGITAAEAGKDIKQFTGSITSMSDFSGGEAKDALQTLTEKGMSFGESLKNSTLLANVAAGSHKTLTEAAGLLADAYNGKTRALTALGILTKDEAKQLGDSENATISMTTVQERLNDRFGGAAQAQLSTYSGKMKENTNEINAAKTAIGTALLPVLAKVADAAAKVIVPVAEFIKQNPALTAGILSVIAVLGTLVGGMSLASTVMGVLTPITAALGISVNALIWPVLAVVAAIGLVVAGGVALYQNWDLVKAKASELGAALSATWNSIKTAITTAWNTIAQFFAETWNGITTVVTGAWETLKNTVNNGLIAIQNFLQPALMFYQIIIQNTWDIIKNIVLGAVLIVIDIVTGNFTQLKSDLDNIWSNIKTALSNIWDAIKDIAKTSWDNLKTTVINLTNSIKTGIIDIWNGILAWFRELPGQLQTIGSDMFTSMKNGVMSTITGVKDAIVNGITIAIEWIKALPGEALQWGKDIIMGIVDGIKSAAYAVGDAVKGVAQDIRKFLHFSVPDEGPLVDFESWMPDFMASLAAGIEKNKYMVKNAIKGLSADMTIGIKGNEGSLSHSISGENGAATVNTGAPNVFYVTLDAHNVKDFTDVVNLFNGLPQVIRQGV